MNAQHPLDGYIQELREYNPDQTITVVKASSFGAAIHGTR